MSRVDRHPVFVLHKRAWRDTSLILELLARDHGRIAAVARAARSQRSPWFGLSEPFRLLEASWTRRGEMATLTGLEPAAGPHRSSGRALWCGLYANELLLRLLPRDDAEPRVFDAYAELLPQLEREARQGWALRRFEYLLLEQLGHAPDLAHATDGAAIEAASHYRVDPAGGAAPVADARVGVPGTMLLALTGHGPARAQDHAAARTLMRQLIEPHLDGRPLSTPALFRESQT